VYKPTSRTQNSQSRFPKAGLTIVRGRLVKGCVNSDTRCFVYKIISLPNIGGQTKLLRKLKMRASQTSSASPEIRALPDITSGPEVRQIFKIRTVRKPDVFLPGHRTFNSFRNRRKDPKKILKFFFLKFFLFYFQIHTNLNFLTPNFCPGTLSYEN
jgi:hypothetical protein